MIDNTKAFLKEYISLCEKHQLELESDDPYCGLGVVELKDEINSPKFCPISNLLEHFDL